MARPEEPPVPAETRMAANARLQGMWEQIHQGRGSQEVNDAARLDGRWTRTQKAAGDGQGQDAIIFFIFQGEQILPY